MGDSPRHPVLPVLTADLARHVCGRLRTRDVVLSYFTRPGFKAVALFRLANWCAEKRLPIIPSLLVSHAVHTTGAEIQPRAMIGPGLLLRHPVGIVIGGGAVVGRNCTILQNVTLGERYGPTDGHRYPTLGNNVTVCAGACILGECHIGDNVMIGANAVVISDIPSGATAVGVPARVVSLAASSANL